MMEFLYIGNFENFYIFGTNPLGVKYDGILYKNGIEDYTIDKFFIVKTKIHKNYWSAEFQIPLSEFKFEKVKDTLKLKICIMRLRPREIREVYSWPALSIKNPSIFSQSKTLVIISPVKIKKRECLPSFVIFKDDLQRFTIKNFICNFGFIYKSVFLHNVTLDLAFNPDYAQIETDEPRIDVNTNLPFSILRKDHFLWGVKHFLKHQ